MSGKATWNRHVMWLSWSSTPKPNFISCWFMKPWWCCCLDCLPMLAFSLQTSPYLCKPTKSCPSFLCHGINYGCICGTWQLLEGELVRFHLSSFYVWLQIQWIISNSEWKPFQFFLTVIKNITLNSINEKDYFYLMKKNLLKIEAGGNHMNSPYSFTVIRERKSYFSNFTSEGVWRVVDI